MKRPKRVTVIASFPLRGQEHITILIGHTYEVVAFDSETEQATVLCENLRFNGKIVLNRNEYAIA